MPVHYGPCQWDLLRDRLKEGPATMEDLAHTLWGEEWNWPLCWQDCLLVTLSRVKKEIAPQGWEIKRTNLYEIVAGH